MPKLTVRDTRSKDEVTANALENAKKFAYLSFMMFGYFMFGLYFSTHHGGLTDPVWVFTLTCLGGTFLLSLFASVKSYIEYHKNR